MKEALARIGSKDTRRSFFIPCNTCNLQPATRNSAFTLVELASVLVIIALIIGMTVNAGVTVLGSSKYASTLQKMAAIDQALMAYRLANDRLPCPSDLTQVMGGSTTNTAAYGTAGTCVKASLTNAAPWGVRTYANPLNAAVTAVAEGGVPVSDLGLPYDFMYDGWDNRIRYAVDVTMANTGMNGNIPKNNNTFTGTEIGAQCGHITIQGDPMPTTSTYNIATHNYTRSSAAIYALISHGPNGHGAFTRNGTILNASSQNADELTNCNCSNAASMNTNITGTYVQQQPYTYNTANLTYNFDDIVTYKERWQMAAPWDTPGTTCPLIYVVDTANSRIAVFDMNGNYLQAIESWGNCTNTGLWNPYGAYVDNASTLWVADTTNHRVQKLTLSASGTSTSYSTSINAACTANSAGNGLLNGPSGITISSNNVWVADKSLNYVQKFDSNLNFILGVGYNYNNIPSSAPVNGNPGYNNGNFWTPYSLTADPAGNIWVADSSNDRLQKFDSNGNWLLSVGWSNNSSGTCTSSQGFSCETTPCTGGGGTQAACAIGASSNANTSQLSSPYGIASDQSGNIFVTDSGNNQIAEFSNAGNYINRIVPGTVSSLKGIAVDPSGNVWVTDGGNSTISKCTNVNGTWNSCTSFGSGIVNGPLGIAIPPAR